MPYIKKERRLIFLNILTLISNLFKTTEVTPGDLNYFLSSILSIYKDSATPCYSTYNDMIGVLECAKLELYRKRVAPYEEIKIKENGDV